MVFLVVEACILGIAISMTFIPPTPKSRQDVTNFHYFFSL